MSKLQANCSLTRGQIVQPTAFYTHSEHVRTRSRVNEWLETNQLLMLNNARTFEQRSLGKVRQRKWSLGIAEHSLHHMLVPCSLVRLPKAVYKQYPRRKAFPAPNYYKVIWPCDSQDWKHWLTRDFCLAYMVEIFWNTHRLLSRSGLPASWRIDGGRPRGQPQHAATASITSGTTSQLVAPRHVGD
jgi:hypothetical protein